MADSKDKKNKDSLIEKQFVIFSAGNEEFGVDINEVREIIKMDSVTKTPNHKDFVEGILDLRGNIVVVVDLARKLGLKTGQRTKDTRTIIIEIGHDTLGMVVDSCNEVIRLPLNEIKDAPEMIKDKIDEEFIEGVGLIGDRMITILDLKKAFKN